jgi:hypothetical protein
MERPQGTLATETIEESFTHFLSQGAQDEPGEPGDSEEAQDLEEGLLETFKHKPRWGAARARLAEAFGDLVDSDELREAREAQDLAMEAALDAIEEAYLDLHSIVRMLSAEERRQGLAKAPLLQCVLRLEKIDDVLAHARRGFFNFPHLPRLTYLTAYILQAYLKLNPLEKPEGMAESVFGRINEALRIAMEGVYRERHQRITFEMSGASQDLAYVYDHHDKHSLTRWVEVGEKAALVHHAHAVLQERIADRYVESKPFGEVSEMVTRLSGQGEAVSWATVKESCVFIDLTEEANAELSDSIKDLALDWVKAQYFPELSSAIQASAPQPAVLGDLFDILLTQFLDGFLKPRTGARLAAHIASRYFNPILHRVITGILGGVARIARDDLSDRSAAATRLLNLAHITRINLAFEHCFHAYMNRFDIVRDNQNYGRPADWETALGRSIELEWALLGNNGTGHGIHYQTHQLLSEAVVMRLNILLGAYESARLDGSAHFLAARVHDLNTFLRNWYGYLQQLFQQSYHRTRGSGDIIRRGGGSFYWNVYASDALNRLTLSHPQFRDGYPITNTAVFGFGNRIDFLVTLNTELHNFCRAHDTTVRELNRRGIINGSAHPRAVDTIFHSTFIQGRYLARGNQFVDESQRHGNWPGAHGQWDSLLFSRIQSERARRPRSDDFGVTLHPSNIILSVGDYPDLEEQSIFNSNLSLTNSLRVPVGLVAIMYPLRNFQGGARAFPMQASSTASTHSPGMTVRSMKIRTDVGDRWFPGKPNYHLGRLITGYGHWQGGWNHPVSPPLVQLP